ncbi:imidazolonepropionase [Pseudoroseicyclus tamaricis]|uniref:Imidazolonepropionase n=1 Tax=Pseudoroseicyclus tamaricis TaxID=2705421 RepID=A0A6B2JUA4_9RHOB|nr:imidazolonepropionase [Pseudoroseicyclus tamaricis]NDV00189.1 imidazolonepropionase [Pseudoroseicyclus tamaricis]
MLYTHARLATFAAPGRYGLVEDGALAVEGERIAWAGPLAELPQAWRGQEAEDLGGRLVTPGLIDCHTHIVFGGHRADEFEMRLEGASYEEIARAGGGIGSTVRATRLASEDVLLEGALTRADALIGEGVTTLEIKSGYGLEAETELRMLRVARRIGELRPVTVRTSYLAAHAVPPEYSGRADAYIDEIVIPVMHEGRGLIDAVDGFCEGIAFDTAQIGRVFDAAASLGLPVKLHAEQLSHMGGAALAARHGALSADHLEHASAEDAAAMAAAGTVAVMLPGAYYTLRDTQAPPVQAFRDAGVPMAVATDCNPGSSPLASLLTAMNMACTLFRLTPEEALAGVTVHAAKALGLADRGTLAAGQRADLAVWDVETPAELAYRIGWNPLHARIHGGTKC